MFQRLARQFLRALTLLEYAVAGTSFLLITLLLFADVMSREVLGNGIYGAQRVAVYCMAIAAFVGFALTTHLGGHFRIEGLERLLPHRFDRVLARLGDIISCGLCLFLAYWAARFVAVSFQNDERGVALGVVVWPIQTAMIWMFLSSAIRHAIFAAWPALKPSAPEIGQ
jgi:TRAP-type C4-dicarboxylate transport system permease small subunit